MNDSPMLDSSSRRPVEAAANLRPLRIWPVAAALLLMVATRTLPRFVGEGGDSLWMVAFLGPAAGCLLLLLWWLLASRATGRERLLGALGLVLVYLGARLLSHATVRGPVEILISLPLGFAAFGLAALLVARSRSPRRLAVIVLGAALGFGFPVLLRNEGVRGDFGFELRWRWSTTGEERMLAEARAADELPAVAGAGFDLAAPAWPGFRGAGRDARVPGVTLATDWETTPPELLWRTRLGPGWSSFAVAGGHLFTQEQRGPAEATVCLDAATGGRVWIREVAARFEEAMGGPGPRATPTLADGALFVLGADGNLARLDPRTGAVAWEVELAEVAGREPPTWGFSASPLVIAGGVVVHAGGADGRGTLAFDADTGELAWSAPAGDHAYGSAQRVELAGEELVAVLTNAGLDLLEPATGAVRLAYEWPHRGYRALQPASLEDGDLLLPTGPGAGTRRLRLERDGDGWSGSEVWTSRYLKPDFNDLVVHGGHAYGFDGSIFTCVDLADGGRAWKDGRYGKGQVLLLPQADQLLVSAESGELILLAADPGAHRELARAQVLEGKTWNHAALVGARLYVRNAEEAACWRLPLVARADD